MKFQNELRYIWSFSIYILIATFYSGRIGYLWMNLSRYLLTKYVYNKRKNRKKSFKMFTIFGSKVSHSQASFSCFISSPVLKLVLVIISDW